MYELLAVLCVWFFCGSFAAYVLWQHTTKEKREEETAEGKTGCYTALLFLGTISFAVILGLLAASYFFPDKEADADKIRCVRIILADAAIALHSHGCSEQNAAPCAGCDALGYIKKAMDVLDEEEKG